MCVCVCVCMRVCVCVCMALLIGDLRFCVLVQQRRTADDLYRLNPALHASVPRRARQGGGD